MNELQVALDARVSSEQQVEVKTIESQLAEIRARIAADGFALPSIWEFIDDGYSGATLVRPALERLRDVAAAGGSDRLYVHCPDRFARIIHLTSERLAEAASSTSHDQTHLCPASPLTQTEADPMLTQEHVQEEPSQEPLSYQQAVALLDTLPGINQRIAEIVIAEIGVEMRRFPSANHLASWVGICPGNHQSAGKQLSGKTRKGARWLRQALIEAAHGAMRTKDTY